MTTLVLAGTPPLQGFLRTGAYVGLALSVWLLAEALVFDRLSPRRYRAAFGVFALSLGLLLLLRD